MVASPRRWLRIAGSLLALGFLCHAATAADLDPIKFRVEFYAIAGLHVLTIHESVGESADRYAISMRIQSRGLADLFAPVDSRTEVDGRIVQGQAYSQSFQSDIWRGSREARAVATFGLDGPLSYRRDPPRGGPVAPELLKGAVDEHTAYYRLERQLARTGSCALSVPVFDGLHRFDLDFADLPPADSDQRTDGRFAGPIKSCEMTRRNIAGFPPGHSSDGVDRGKMWFAHLIPNSAVMLPIRMELDTEIGTVTGYLAEINGRGVHLVLME
jgi:uncharacterized protein DUF3108